MQTFRLFFTVFFLIISLLVFIVIAILDHTVYVRAANMLMDHLVPVGIAAFLFLILISSGVVSNQARMEGSLMNNGFFQLAILELFLFAAGLVYFRQYSQQPGQILLQLQPENTKPVVDVGITYRSGEGGLTDTVQAPATLTDRRPGNYTIELLDADLVYFREDVELGPAETATLVIPVALNSKTLTVQTEPAGAEIWINGVQASQTPDSFRILTGDTAVLELKLPGYQIHTDTLILIENTDLGIISLRKLYSLWITGLYADSRYTIYDEDSRIVISSSGARKFQLPQGSYRISFEIGEGQYRSKSFSVKYNSSINLP